MPGGPTTTHRGPGEQATGSPGSGGPLTGSPGRDGALTRHPGLGEQVTGSPWPSGPLTGSPVPGEQAPRRPGSGEPLTGSPVPGEQATRPPGSGRPLTRSPVPDGSAKPRPAPGVPEAAGCRGSGPMRGAGVGCPHGWVCGPGGRRLTSSRPRLDRGPTSSRSRPRLRLAGPGRGVGGSPGVGGWRRGVLPCSMRPPFPRARAVVLVRGPACVLRWPGADVVVRPGHAYPHDPAGIPAWLPGRSRPPCARHSTACSGANGNQSAAPGHLPGSSPYPAVIQSGRLRS